MLEIVFFILKVLMLLIGICAGVFLLVLCLVLFAPIRYRAKGSKYEEAMKLRAVVSYLNPIVRVYISYPDGELVCIKICGFTIYKTKKEQGKQQTGYAEEKTTKEQNVVLEDSKKESPKKTDVVKENKKEQTTTKQPKKTKNEQETKGTVVQSEQTKDTAKQKADAVETSEKQTDTNSDKLDGIRYYISLYQENKALIFKVLKTIWKALKTLLPTSCKANVFLGTGQPDVTGYIYAAYCGLQAYLPKGLEYHPMWTEQVLEGEFEIKGRIRLIHLLVAAVKLLINKDVRLLIKKCKRS